MPAINGQLGGFEFSEFFDDPEFWDRRAGHADAVGLIIDLVEDVLGNVDVDALHRGMDGDVLKVEHPKVLAALKRLIELCGRHCDFHGFSC